MSNESSKVKIFSLGDLDMFRYRAVFIYLQSNRRHKL